MLYCAIEQTEGSPAYLGFPLNSETGFSETYQNRIQPVFEQTEGGEGGSVGLWGHPPYYVWKGGKIEPIRFSTILAAGSESYTGHTEPKTRTPDQLMVFAEKVASLAAPDPNVSSGEIWYPRRLHLRVGWVNSRSENADEWKLSEKEAASGKAFFNFDKAWYSRKGYVTQVKTKFGEPYDAKSGNPIVISIDFTFVPTTAYLFGSDKQTDSEEVSRDQLPHIPYKYGDADPGNWKK